MACEFKCVKTAAVSTPSVWLRPVNAKHGELCVHIANHWLVMVVTWHNCQQSEGLNWLQWHM